MAWIVFLAISTNYSRNFPIRVIQDNDTIHNALSQCVKIMGHSASDIWLFQVGRRGMITNGIIMYICDIVPIVNASNHIKCMHKSGQWVWDVSATYRQSSDSVYVIRKSEFTMRCTVPHTRTLACNMLTK